MVNRARSKESNSIHIQEALDLYVIQLSADGRSEHTMGQARRHVRMFAAWMGNTPIAKVTHEDVARFLASDVVRKRCDGRERRASSGNALRSSLRGFFGYAHASGLTKTNAARLVRRAMCPAARPKALSERDCAKLMAAFKGATTEAERRDRALFTTLLRVGLRVGNAVALDVDDVDLRAGEIRLRKVKGGLEDIVYVPDDLKPVLRSQIGRRTSGPLFQTQAGTMLSTRTVAKRLSLWAARAGVEGHVWPHRLRHSFGMRVYARTGDVLLTARAMCHRSIASTASYARPDPARVRKAIE